MKLRRVWAVAANVTFGALALLHAQEPADVLFHKEVKETEVRNRAVCL